MFLLLSQVEDEFRDGCSPESDPRSVKNKKSPMDPKHLRSEELDLSRFEELQRLLVEVGSIKNMDLNNRK